MVEGSLAASAHCQLWFSGNIEPVVAKVDLIRVGAWVDVGRGAIGFVSGRIEPL